MADLKVVNGDSSSPQGVEPSTSNGVASGPGDAAKKQRDDVLHSDIGISILLGRLKQSLASARDFSEFLQHRAKFEDQHAAGLRKLSKMNYGSAQRQESRQGSFALQMGDVSKVHDKMAENGIQFASSLHQMHDDLAELTANMERGRKRWKEQGLNNEKRVKEAELLMEKAKARLDSSADNYERAKTGDSSGRVFGIKGPKSAEQREEDLHRKVQNADSDYASKVQSAQSARQENLSSLRPQAVQAIQELIAECDSALTLQLQKFASFNERLLVNNGLVISPVRNPEEAVGMPSMREMIQRIDNEKDFHSYVMSHSSTVPAKAPDYTYQKHPTLGGPAQSTISAPLKQDKPQPQPPTTSSSFQPSSMNSNTARQANLPIPQSATSPTQHGFPPAGPGPHQPPDRSFSGPGPNQSQTSLSMPQPQPPPKTMTPPPISPSPPSYGAFKPPGSSSGPGSAAPPSSRPGMGSHQASGNSGANLPAYNRVFGLSLDELFRRDETAVPLVVYQCIQAIDLFGLEVQGIYRQSGSANHVHQLKAQFDHDPSRVDFRNPESFFHDVNSVSGLLKQFFRELPDPLFTNENYADFIEAARVEDPTQRRDSIHAIINNLPDPNYATLRAVVLHLNRVQEHQEVNRMSTSNLSICFAPTMMGPHTGASMADAGLQTRALDTILTNTYQIFDED